MNYNFSNIKTAKSTGYNPGLANYMNSIYKNMSMALGISGIVAFLVANIPALASMVINMHMLFALAPLGYVMYFSAKVSRMSSEESKRSLCIFAGLMGISLSTLLFAYTGASIVKTFFVTSATFLSMSLYGYKTKKDLTDIGAFMRMGLWGIIIASLVNIFMRSSQMDLIISILGVIIFTVLTAYDVQKLKQTYYSIGGSEEISNKVAVIGALTLYMDFINLFIFLLRFMGNSRER